MRAAWPLLLLMTALAGCSSDAPPAQDPVPPVADAPVEWQHVTGRFPLNPLACVVTAGNTDTSTGVWEWSAPLDDRAWGQEYVGYVNLTGGTELSVGLEFYYEGSTPSQTYNQGASGEAMRGIVPDLGLPVRVVFQGCGVGVAEAVVDFHVPLAPQP